MIRPRAAALRERIKASIVAAADVGSTSLHLVVAAVAGRRLDVQADESVFLGLGDAVDAQSILGPVLTDTLAVTIAGLAERGRALGATEVAFVGTDPLRRAADAARAVDAVRRSGNALFVLSQDEEGLLTLLGVTEGRRISRPILVVDVGGGSSEFVLAAPGERPQTVGLPLGAGRLTRQVVRHDPPTLAEVEEMRQVATELLAGGPDAGPLDLVLVGGTATNLLRLAPSTSPTGRLTMQGLERAQDTLTARPVAAIAAGRAIRPQRVLLLPAGAAIVGAVLQRYRPAGARVSERGVREGTIRALARAGAGWRDSLPELARGW